MSKPEQDADDTTYSHVLRDVSSHRRRTPSAPMAALDPQNTEDPDTTMGPRTRDEVLLKTLARTERIDTEIEDAFAKMEATVREARLTRTYQQDLAKTVRRLERKMDVITRLLTDVLTRLPEST